ncbi:hypothetical protein VXS12_17790 [Acinetobacter baumannii]|uniref:hypothetical protein n=1 Tax=Acinetobacter baumannii TaxID=470 RepID=UPI002A74C529|nr:hypothetical protein [Acinetobacter baumannii]MEC6741833.1 hypothetical protein [Acinetobacter baumannii]WPQ53613.1 hypothetical protein SLQ83_05445 [Acinetobacter baumannii]
MLTVDQLCQIASYGGGLELNAKSYTHDQLSTIASYASNKGARITIDLIDRKFTSDQLCTIASFGKGCVSFKNL